MDIVPEGYLLNGQGHLVPVEHISQYELLRDGLVRELIGQAQELSGSVSTFRKKAMGDVDALLNTAREEHGVKVGGKRGGTTLTSYDGLLQVQVSVNDFLSFDERLTVAKELIDEYLKKLTADSPSELKLLVNQAFEVDKQGRISASKVLGLTKVPIKDEQWEEAMKAIRESLTVERSKSYIRFRQRCTIDGEWQPIHLDIAKL